MKNKIIIFIFVLLIGSAVSCKTDGQGIPKPEEVFDKPWHMERGEVGQGISESEEVFDEVIYDRQVYTCVYSAAGFYPYEDGTDFITDFLTEHGMYKPMPDGSSYDIHGRPFIEYYIDEDENRYSFIVYFWNNFRSFDEEPQINAVFCATVYLNDSEITGNFMCDFDAERGVFHEEKYDAQGNFISGVSYEFRAGIPFPFIIEYSGEEYSYSGLIPGQKFWFYREFSVFDESERWIAYGGNSRYIAPNDYFMLSDFMGICTYNEEDRLERIRMEIPRDYIETMVEWREEADYSIRFEFDYHENGNLRSVEYWRSPWVGGTGDSSGIILYDEQERMIENTYYVTHGSHTNLYLYDNDSDKPWACFQLCSFTSVGFEGIQLFF